MAFLQQLFVGAVLGQSRTRVRSLPVRSTASICSKNSHFRVASACLGLVPGSAFFNSIVLVATYYCIANAITQ